MAGFGSSSLPVSTNVDEGRESAK